MMMQPCMLTNDPSLSNTSTSLQPNSTDPCYGAWTASNKAALVNCFSKMFVMNCNAVCIDGKSDFMSSASRKFAQSQCDALKTACDAAFTSHSCNMNSNSGANYTLTYFTATMCAATATPAGFPAITAVGSAEVDKVFSALSGSTGSTGSASSVVANVALVIAAFVAFLF